MEKRASRPREWFEEWFDDTYFDLYQHRDATEAEAFVTWLAAHFPAAGSGRVADLACGAGRHTWAMARLLGWQVTGVDLSASMLRRAAVSPEPGVQPQPRFIRGDLRHLPLVSSSFHLAVNLFTSFGYFHSRHEHLTALRETARILHPGGLFFLDLLNPHLTIAGLIAHDEQRMEGLRVQQDRRYDAKLGRLEKVIRIFCEGGPSRTVTESIRLFDEEEITALLEEACFTIEAMFGGYGGRSYDPSRSERMILVARTSA